MHGALSASLVEVDSEVFDGRRGLGDGHRSAQQVFLLSGVVGAPLTGFLADHEGPLAGIRHSKQCVATGRNALTANTQVRVGDEGSRFIRASAPNLPAGDEGVART